MTTSPRFLSFVPSTPAPVRAASSRASLTPCFRFTNSGQATFLPAHHPKSLRPNPNHPTPAGAPGIQPTPADFDTYEVDHYFNQNLFADADADLHADASLDAEFDDCEYQITATLVDNNAEYDRDMRKDAAAQWLAAKVGGLICEQTIAHMQADNLYNPSNLRRINGGE